MTDHINHHIGGESLVDSGAKTRSVFNPALGDIIANVPLAREDYCNKAVQAAQHAFKDWSETPPLKRARILFRFRELLEINKNELAELVTREHGKTLEDAHGSIARAIEVVELHCGLLNQLQGTFTANAATGIDCQTLLAPLGVCVGVSPFNFPVMVPVWMMIPAIACGNTFILKPSEQNPSAPLRLIELLEEAGLPAGVANCLQGDKTTVDLLLHHNDISAFTAVASTPVAEAIYTTATSQGKRANTFGGAKNHALVMPDADMMQTAQAIVGAAFGSAGERCMAISVVVTVGDGTSNDLTPHLTELINAIRIGSGHQSTTDMGPLISQAHRERVIAAINAGVQEGAKLLIDGRDYNHPDLPQGFFMGPCLFDEVNESMSIYQQEIFGPVLVIIHAENFEAALSLINRHQYGNGTAIFTRDGYAAREFSQRVQAGMVGVNVPIPVPIAYHPFGGWKRSAFGDTGMHASESIHFYTRRKTITTRWPKPNDLAQGFIMPSHD